MTTPFKDDLHVLSISNTVKDTHSNPMSKSNDTSHSHIETFSTEDKRKKKKKNYKKVFFSSKYTVYLFSLWLIFISAFIVGFILHYEVSNLVTAAGIMWGFSAVIFVLAVLYSWVYFKAKYAQSNEEMAKYLKIFPC